MEPVKVRNLEIGKGIPKICAPIVGKFTEDILEAAREIAASAADLAEWRVDWFEEVFDFEKVVEVLAGLREVLGDCPLLFTCRSSREGGELSLTAQQYFALNQCALESGYIDLLDVEIFGHSELAEELINKAHDFGVKVIGSYHNFQSTPSGKEIVERLHAMHKAGADIAKIAVMPQSGEDVDILLNATKEAAKDAVGPIVTISMGELGVRSRVCGGKFGSGITFGTVGKASAPGQISVEMLKKDRVYVNSGRSKV